MQEDLTSLYTQYSGIVDGAFLLIGGFVLHMVYEFIKSRLHHSNKHKYDSQLENKKADIAKESAFYTSVFSSFSNGQHAAMNRKLDGIERLWGTFLKLKNNRPEILFMNDLLTEQEFEIYLKRNDRPSFQSNDTIEQVKKCVPNDDEELRPFLDEYTWLLYTAYKTVFFRSIFLILNSQAGEPSALWYKDENILKLLKSVLTSEEYNYFIEAEFWKFSTMQNFLEEKILLRMRKVISGESNINPTIDKAHEIARLVDEIERKNKPLSSKKG